MGACAQSPFSPSPDHCGWCVTGVLQSNFAVGCLAWCLPGAADTQQLGRTDGAGWSLLCGAYTRCMCVCAILYILTQRQPGSGTRQAGSRNSDPPRSLCISPCLHCGQASKQAWFLLLAGAAGCCWLLLAAAAAWAGGGHYSM